MTLLVYSWALWMINLTPKVQYTSMLESFVLLKLWTNVWFWTCIPSCCDIVSVPLSNFSDSFNTKHTIYKFKGNLGSLQDCPFFQSFEPKLGSEHASPCLCDTLIVSLILVNCSFNTESSFYKFEGNLGSMLKNPIFSKFCTKTWIWTLEAYLGIENRLVGTLDKLNMPWGGGIYIWAKISHVWTCILAVN